MKNLVLLVVSIIMSTQVAALGQTGHRVTGEIAEKYLSKHSKRQIEQILDNESLAEISTYVDQMRSEPTTYWKKTSKKHYQNAS